MELGTLDGGDEGFWLGAELGLSFGDALGVSLGLSFGWILGSWEG